jgi:hypothetical protein
MGSTVNISCDDLKAAGAQCITDDEAKTSSRTGDNGYSTVAVK